MIRNLTIAVVLYSLCSALAVSWVYRDSLRSEFSSTVEQGEVRLSEATSRLAGQFEVLRVLVNLIAQDRRMADILQGSFVGDADETLKLYSLKYGAWQISLSDARGDVLASSNPENVHDYPQDKLIDAAMNGGLGYEAFYRGDQRFVRFSRGVLNQSRDTIGAVILTADLANLEFEWPVTPEPVLFFDDSGISISSNRPELLLLNQKTPSGENAFPIQFSDRRAGFELWKYQSEQDEVSTILLLQRRIDQLQMQAWILLDTSSARGTALLRMWLAVALALMIFLAACLGNAAFSNIGN